VHTAGLRHADPVDVAVEIEVGVLDPHRVAQAERNLEHPAPERGQEVEAVGQHLIVSKA
jgi:hypothetical protein